MKIYEITEAIGPHQGNELELMMKGTKPAALIDHRHLAQWRPYIDKFKWAVGTSQSFGGPRMIIVAKDPTSVKQIAQLYDSAIRAGKASPEFHTQLGRLLGYSADDIAEFLAYKGHTMPGGTIHMLKYMGRQLMGLAPMLALHHSELGPTVPSAGPQRGNEINTDTGQPWTPEQLKKYNQTHGTE